MRIWRARIRLPAPADGRPRRRLSPVLLLVSLLLVILLPSTAGCQDEPAASDAVPSWPGGPGWQWQWQLTGPLDLAVDAEVFLLDPVTTIAAQTDELRRHGRWLVCQVSVGAYAQSDPDAGRFPVEVRGADQPGSGRPGSGRWLDVRRWDDLQPVLADRFRLCRGKRFGAVALAHADGYAHRSGFPLTFDDQLRFNRQAAALARSFGLSPGLVNDVPQVTALAPDFDFAVNSGCVRRRECQRLLPFVEAGKPVLHAEFDGSGTDFCVTTVGYGFVSIRKKPELDAWRLPCPAG